MKRVERRRSGAWARAFAVAAGGVLAVTVTVAGSAATPFLSADAHKTTPTWQLTVADPGTFNAVSCATRRDCVATTTVDGTDYAITYDGKTWGPLRQLGEYMGEVVSLSCPVAGWCIALTDRAFAAVLSNGRWSPFKTIDPTPVAPYPGIANSISCVSRQRCVAVDGQGDAETYNGSSWTKPDLIDESYPLNDVACTTINYCVAVDGGGRVLELVRGAWSTPALVDDAALTGVSCGSTDFCVAVDLAGRVLVGQGVSWSRPRAVDQVLASPLAISCPVVGRCLVVDSEGREVILTQGRWSPPDAVTSDSGRVSSLVGVSCPTGALEFCAAVSAYRDALTTSDPFQPPR